MFRNRTEAMWDWRGPGHGPVLTLLSLALTELLQFIDCGCYVQDKVEKQHAATHRTISELEAKLLKAEAFGDALQKYVREIEQANDDLERAKR